ncbi:tape measure protein [Flavonifractor plautii]|uniref:tape measure protein n=1 Tax=Flavonifractor plautii TaxID=292800 RepID=UPI00356AA51C
MSRTIDERIVEMRFDNRQFEQNVQTSLSTLDKLKRGLDLDNAAKSLDGLGDAAKRCDMSVLGKSVETVQAKFSAFQVVAMTTLSNITNSAVNTGKRLVSALTIDPIKTGFQEYETQIGAVQTILANTQHEGTNLQQVNRALDELNTYADKTIYNFTEMTRNIGTFTAAGVNLRTSVDSIKGIANLAAISGSTSQQASTAMYQLSQALAAGKVSLMDWNSVVNAGMGGKVFQDALVRTSELLGTGAQNAINMYGSFRESLTRGEWLTTEVLTETLKQFAGAYSEADLIQQGFSEAQARDIAQMAKTAEDAATKVKTFTQLWDTLKESAQSGWTTTWEILVGDFEEAKEVLTEVSDAIGGVISETSQARNELLSGGLSSGWKQLLDQGIADEGRFIESIQEVARESGDAFDKLVADSESFSDALKQGLTDGVVSSETLTQAVHNLREKMTGMSQEERKAAGYTAEMIEQIEALDKGLQNGSVSMEEFTEKILRPSGRENLIQAVWNAAKGLVSVITPIKDAFREIFPPATADQLYSLTETLRSFSERLTFSEETADKLGRTFKGLFSVLDLVRQGALAIFNALAPLGSGAGSLADGILTITAGIGDFLVGINEAAKQGEFFGTVAQTVASALEFVVSGIERLTGFLADAFAAPGLESFQALLGRIQTRIGQVIDAVSGLGGGVSDAADTMDSALENSKFLQMLQTIFNGAKTLVSGIIGVFGGLAGALVESLSNANFSGVIDLLNGVSLGAIALGIKKFLDSFREVTDSVGSIKEGVIGILDGVKGCFQAWQNDVNAKALLKIAAAVAVLSASILTISLIDSEKLTASLGAITVLFTELMAAMAVFGKLDLNVRGTMKRSTAMIALSSSVLILASALKSIATLEPEQMAAGLAGIAGLMAALVAAAKVLGSGSSSIIKGSAQMVVFAAAIKILASACADLAQLDLAGLAKGLIGVGVLLAEVSLFMNAAKFSGRSVVTASGVLVLAGAMKVLASACKDFAQMGVGELVKGLSAIGAVLLEITAFTKLAGSAKGLITTGAAMIEIGAAMKIFASAMADFGRMSLAEIGKGLLAMGGALAEVAVAMRFMPRNMVTMGAGLIAVGAALNIIADAMRSMGGMSWEAVAKSLVTMGGALAELAVGLNFMNGTLGGSAAMLVAAAALAVLTPVLVTLGSMSWEAIAKGLVTVAGAFAVIGTAGALLTPLLPTILGLGGAFALIGVGVAGVGAGLLLVGTGLSAIAVGITALATSLGAGVAIIVAGLTSIITGIAALIPAIAEKLGEAVVAFAQVITNGAPAIGEAVKTLVLTMVDVLVECVPAIAEGALELVAGVLDALVAYTPQIVDSIMQFLIAVIDGLARNMPTLIQSVVDLLMSFFSGIVSALGSIDTDALLKGIAGIGLLSGIMVALGALAGLIPSAMVGVLGLGVVIAELAIVLAAVGALAQIPGLEWLISEGGQLLQTIGNAIGGFIGGIVGGFMSGVSGSFPQIGMDLAAFMTNIQPFIDGARGIDPAMLEGVKALTGAIMLITAADLLEGLTSWLTGGSSLSTFAEELVPFGEAMKKFSHSITGLDGDLVSTAAIAGKTLAEMAATLPNSGGIAGFFAGENDMGAFGDQLVGFGGSMMKFAESIKGLDTDAVQNAAIAGKAMAELAATLPNTGGAVGFFAGNNDMDDFGEQLVPFGAAIKAYSDAVKGLDVEAVTNSAIAGQAMSELAATLPNTGGAVAFFAGDNDLATFGEQLVSFGASIKSYAQEVTGLDTDAVASSTVAGQTLVELANTLPNTGGLVAFFTGDNDLETFGEQLVPFGEAMKAYSDSVTGMDSAAVTASATAAKALAELQASLPNIGGVVDFFTGGNDLETFANGLLPFGEGMKAYADAVSGMDAGAVSASITAAQALAELQASLPHVGGVMSFFTGGNDLGLFAEGILSFGEAMNSYGNAVSGIDAGAVSASATAAQALSRLQASLPNVGGIMEFFTGGNDLGKFSEGIIPFGEAMKAYGESVAGIDSSAVEASATAAQSLAQLQAALPQVGGLMEFFTGGNDLGVFSEGIVPFGAAMKSYAEAVSGINADAVTASAVAAQALAQLQTDLPNVGGVMAFFNGDNDLGTFAAGIVPFGAAMKSYGDAVADINTGAITASATAAQSLARLQEALPLVGGVMEFFNGSQDLAAFAAGIIPFGAAMKSYGDAVADIRPEAVESSASAGMALVELAKALPNTGGLLSFFTGGADLAAFGDDLTLFGADLSAYAEAISNVKADAVTASANAAEALSNLASGLPDSSLFDKWFGGDQTLASFGGDISKFGAAMKDYYGQISGIDTGRMADVVAQVWSLLELAEGAAGVNTSGLTGFADSMRKMGDAGISGFTSTFYNCGDTVNKAVSSMLSAVSGAVLSNLPVTNGAMETVVQSLANIVDGKVPAIRTSTSDMMRTMEASITAHSRTVGDAMRTVLSTAVSNINRMKPEFETAGKNAGQGFINGINSKLGGARSAGRSLGLAALEAAKKALDSHSPSREFIHLGENVGEGLAIGVNNSIVPAAQAASGMIDEVIAVSEKGVDAFEDWINEKQYYGELSLMDELAGWENLQKKYRAGSEERMKIDREVYRVQNELVSATYQASLDWIEEEKYYKRLSTEEELAAYERMQARYLEGSKERMELDRKVFTLRNQLVDESYQNSMDWIEEEKYYNRLSLADELAAYKRVQSRYAKGTEERKKLDREVYRLEQEIYEAQQQYIADVQSVQESANQRRIQLEEAYANKVKSINEQLERDIESLNQQYQDAVESRTKSLYQSYGLFDEVTKKEAVSSEKLMQNLEGQVQEFGEWQDILGQLSARGVDSDLIAELQEMGPSAIEEIRALNSMSDDELEKYVSLWSIKHAQARDQATSELEGLRVETQEQIAQLRADAAVELEEYRLTWQSEMAQLEEDTSRQLASLRQEFSENVGLIKRDTEAKMAEMTEAARKILSEAGWTETGQQIPAGLAQGVAQSKSTFIDELTSMALAGVEAVKSTLEINSPSRVFRELGSFTGLGFVSGLAGYAERSFAAGADMADSAVDGLSGAIAGLPDLLSGEAEMRPTIRPVLDLSDLTGASTQIDSLFYPLRSIRLVGQASLAFQNASGENRMTLKVDNDDIIEELRTLRSEMAEMTERMERMRVVLDTGTLVGEMAGPMDNALGQRAARRGRGN